jgi:hypothetical protein
VEPPTPGQVERVVASAVSRFEEGCARGVVARLGPMACGHLQDLLGRQQVLAELKTVRSLGLDETVFAQVSERVAARPVSVPSLPGNAAPGTR